MSMDCQKIYDYLSGNGFIFTKNPSRADIIIISPCAIIEDLENKSINDLRSHMAKKSRHGRLVIVECSRGINSQLLKNEFSHLDKISTQCLSELDDIIKAEKKFDTIPEPNKIIKFCDNSFLIAAGKAMRDILKADFSMFSRFLNNRRTVCDRFVSKKIYHIRISRGCYGKCAFCVQSNFAEKHQSRPLDEIIKEFRAGLDEGFKLFMLVAHDTGSYGMDKGLTIVKLISELCKIEGDYKLILIDFNVQWFIKYYEELEPLFIVNHKKIERIALAVQSGSDKVIRLMNRNYSAREAAESLLRLRRNLPGCTAKLSVQIMAGFPGETEEDFEQTADLVKKIELPLVNIFGFSERPNTKAAGMAGKIDAATIQKRVYRLIKIKNSYE